MGDKSHIGRAWKIAHELDSEGYSEVDGARILAMALGIFAEGWSDSHRELRPLVDGMVKAAQVGFDALREDRNRKGS